MIPYTSRHISASDAPGGKGKKKKGGGKEKKAGGKAPTHHASIQHRQATAL